MGANGLTTGVIAEIFRGLETDGVEPLAPKLVGRSAPQDITKGTAQILPTGMTLETAPDEGLPEGAMPKKLSRTYSELAYQMLKFVQTSDIPFAEENDFSKKHNEQLAEVEMARCQKVSSLKYDLHLASRLEDTDTLNTAVDVSGGDYGGVWTGASATPIDDIRAILRDVCPGAKYAIIGRKVLDELGKNAQFTSMVANFSGASLNRDKVKEILIAETDLEEIEVFDRWYDVSAEGQDTAVTYVFSNGMWIGHKDNLVDLPLKGNNPRPLRRVIEDFEITTVGYVRRGVIKIPVPGKSAYVTTGVSA